MLAVAFPAVCQVQQRSRHFLAYPFVTAGTMHEAVRDFCKDLSLAPRGHSFAREDGWWNVWCFATREDAEKFQARFGGEFMEPKDRPKWGAGGR